MTPAIGRAVVFDFGGVLFQWAPRRLLREVWPQRVTDDAAAEHWFAQVFQGFAPHGDWAELDRGRLDHNTLATRMAARIDVTAAEVLALFDAVGPHLQPQPDSVALLRRLHEGGVPLFYLSNMPAALADDLEQRHDWMRCFSSGVFSARVHEIKPEPRIFELAQQRFGVEPQQLVFIDDHPANVEAARRAGWRALQFTSAAQCEAALAPLLHG